MSTDFLLAGSLLQNEKYRILRALGQGGFGITYLAEHVFLGRKVAIKEFFLKDLCERQSDTHEVTMGTTNSRATVLRYRNKFLKEARNIASLHHPHIVQVIDVFEENGTAYFIMEYCPGGNLSRLIEQKGHLSEAEAATYICQLAGALQHLHERRMNHLDVKPANVMLNERGEAVLIDFGLSKQYDEHGEQTSSTPVGLSDGYAPLEQYDQSGLTAFSPESDVYALGATYYKMLTGEVPPKASMVNEDGLPLEVLRKHGVSEASIQLIEHAMEPRRKRRLNDVSEFIRVLGSNTPASIEPAQNEDAATEPMVSEEPSVLPVLEEKPTAPKPAPVAQEKTVRMVETPAHKPESPSHKSVEPQTDVAPDEKPKRSNVVFAVLGAILFMGLLGAGISTLVVRGVSDSDTEVQTEEHAPTTLTDARIEVTEGANELRIYQYSGPVEWDPAAKRYLPNGKGKATILEGKSKGAEYVGEFHRGVIQGKGKLEFPSGGYFEGSLSNGYYKEGEYHSPDGNHFRGTFKDGAPAKGHWYDESGKIIG